MLIVEWLHINDKSKFIKFEDNFNPNEHFIQLENGSRNNNIALKKGTVKLMFCDMKGFEHSMYLNNVLYVPSFKV